MSTFWQGALFIVFCWLSLLTAVVACVVVAGRSDRRAETTQQQPEEQPEQRPGDEWLSEECPRCGGAGTVDVLDEWDRPQLFDAACPSCAGSGRAEVWI